MQYTIRPNNINPAWPAKPDPSDLQAAQRLEPDPKKATALALTMTRDRAARSVRHGCASQNLDWLLMVAELRQKLSGEGNIGWIDGVCPNSIEEDKGKEPITVVATANYRNPYCYITFAVQA